MPTPAKIHETTQRRKRRTRAHLAANTSVPRLSVHRTLRHIYVQVIDDQQGRTLAAASDVSVKATGTKTEVARLVGEAIAEQAKKLKLEAVRFDRGAFQYHGRVAAVADGARSKGLQF
jgi:large subunit ribosomal protein L18